MESEKAIKERKVIDVEQFFGALDGMIKSAEGHNVLHLRRDKFAFYLMYAMALRPSEVLNLDAGSFRPATGTASAYGAMVLNLVGDRRKGMQTVTVLDNEVPAMLADYMENVRPYFAEKANTDAVDALFLSERGRRLSLSMLHGRFKGILEQAGLDEEGHALNSLRFTGLCDLSRRISLESMHRYTSVSPLKNSASTFRHQVFLSGLKHFDYMSDQENGESSVGPEVGLPDTTPSNIYRGHIGETTTGMYIPDPELIGKTRATARAEPEMVRKGKKGTEKVQEGSGGGK